MFQDGNICTIVYKVSFSFRSSRYHSSGQIPVVSVSLSYRRRLSWLIWTNIEGNTDEELCNRWMQLSAFAPFYRNHNQRGALSQEPYRWDSVVDASRSAIATRYSLLPYWVRLSCLFVGAIPDRLSYIGNSVCQCIDPRNSSGSSALV